MSEDVVTDQSHWDQLAARWRHVGPPLRPSPDDIVAYRAAATVGGTPPRALILGVTRELYHLGWPDGTDLHAIDNTPAMVETVWPGRRDEVTLGDWRSMPTSLGPRDVVLCDGGVNMLDYPDDQEAMIDGLAAIVVTGGTVTFRLFASPPEREKPEVVLDDLLAGRIANLNILKLRLGMAMQPDPERGVMLGEIWDRVQAAVPDRAQLTGGIGWEPEHLDAIDAYRGSSSRYTFLSVDQAIALFQASGAFEHRATHIGSYELGERTPMLTFTRR